jgi:hypothetical protein
MTAPGTGHMIVNPRFLARVNTVCFAIVAMVSVFAACWLAVGKPERAYSLLQSHRGSGHSLRVFLLRPHPARCHQKAIDSTKVGNPLLIKTGRKPCTIHTITKTCVTLSGEVTCRNRRKGPLIAEVS